MSSKNLPSNNSKPIIIISGSNTIENQNIRTNKIIIENNGYKAQYETQNKLNKSMIDSTVSYLKQNITTKNQQQQQHQRNNTPNPNHIDQQITTVESNVNPTNPNNNNHKEKLPLKDNSIIQQEQQTQRHHRISDSNLIPTEQQNTFPIVVALVTGGDDNNNNNNITMHKKVITSLTENGNLINHDGDNDYIVNDNNNINENLTSRITSSCLICEKIIPKSNLYHSKTCSHGICRKCIKLYYEDKIEDGIFDNFKCPIYSCKGHFNESLIKVFISSKLFTTAMSKQNNNNNSSLSETSIDTVKMYQEEHVLDINDNKTFFLYPKEKLNACPRCKKEALFGKTNYYFVKCLNCQMKMCRWCLKEFDDEHFDLLKENHCRVYFRTIIEDEKGCKCSKSCICKYLCELFFVIAGFFMMFIGGFYYISSCVNYVFCQCEEKGKEKGKCVGCFVTMLLVVVKVIVFVICVPVLLVTFPFFPVFIAMIGM